MFYTHAPTPHPSWAPLFVEVYAPQKIHERDPFLAQSERDVERRQCTQTGALSWHGYSGLTQSKLQCVEGPLYKNNLSESMCQILRFSAPHQLWEIWARPYGYHTALHLSSINLLLERRLSVFSLGINCMF